MTKKAKTKETAVATIGERFPILVSGGEKVVEIIKENVGVDTLSPFDLERIKIPSGGGMFFEVPSLEGATPETELRGVLIYHRRARAFWLGTGDPDNSAPDCFSDDGLIGNGDRTGGGETTAQNCTNCQHAQWGTKVGKDGEPTKGQACKAMQFLFLLREGELLPTVISLPPTSVKKSKTFLLALASKGIGYWQVELSISLVEANSSGGIKYAVAQFKVAGRLTEKEAALALAYRESIKGILDAVAPGNDDEPTDE